MLQKTGTDVLFSQKTETVSINEWRPINFTEIFGPKRLNIEFLNEKSPNNIHQHLNMLFSIIELKVNIRLGSTQGRNFQINDF